MAPLTETTQKVIMNKVTNC